MCIRDSDEATETLIAGRDLIVDNPPLEAQFWSSLGDAYNEGKEYTKSDQAYDKALIIEPDNACLLYTSPSPRDRTRSRMPSSA